MFEKKALDSMKPASREIVLEALRKEVSSLLRPAAMEAMSCNDLSLSYLAQAGSLSRLRHPCILEMVEPMEETRSA